MYFFVLWNEKKYCWVLSEKFLNEVLRVLKFRGFLELCIDDSFYFEDSLKLVLKNF